MATICAGCAKGKQLQGLPPVRTTSAPCDFCGGYDMMYDQRTGQGTPWKRNYDFPDILLPGHPTNQDTIAEREERQA